MKDTLAYHVQSSALTFSQKKEVFLFLPQSQIVAHKVVLRMCMNASNIF